MVCAGSTAAAFNVRQRLRHDWPELLLPAFDKAFDAAASGEEIIHVPKIELRLQIASEEELTALLPELIHRQIAEQLG